MRTTIDRTYEFRYDVDEKEFKLLLASCATLIAAVIWIALALPRLNFVFYLISFLFVADISVVLMYALFLLLEARRRLSHRIIVSPDGIVFDDGRQRIEARWDEVTELRTELFLVFFRRYIVVTANGTFDFTSALKDVKTLLTFLAHHAVNAEKKDWKV